MWYIKILKLIVTNFFHRCIDTNLNQLLFTSSTNHVILSWQFTTTFWPAILHTNYDVVIYKIF